MVVNSQLQIKGILSLIMHQTQVGIPDRIFEIHLDEFLPYPDYYSILEMLQVRKVIRIKREPEDRESVMLEVNSTPSYLALFSGNLVMQLARIKTLQATALRYLVRHIKIRST